MTLVRKHKPWVDWIQGWRVHFIRGNNRLGQLAFNDVPFPQYCSVLAKARQNGRIHTSEREYNVSKAGRQHDIGLAKTASRARSLGTKGPRHLFGAP